MLKPLKDIAAPKVPAYPLAYPIKPYNREEALQKRGAKKGGLTDHLSGVHLIPNVGREAMVPGEVVRRQPRKPKAKPEPAPKPALKLPLPKVKHRSNGRSRARSQDRSKDRRGRSASSSYSASDEAPVDDATRARLRQEAERRRREEEAAKKRAEEEQRRKEEEQRKLKELEDLRQKQLDMQSERKQKLGGLFALTEDDIDAEEDEKTRRARIAKEKARMEKKALERPALAEPTRASYSTAIAAVGPSTERRSSSSSTTEIAELSTNGNLTAADLDGSLHDHKFSKVWKDWDSGKKSDPGEIARQFMKIAAIKRRGYAPTGRDPLAGRPGSRSRSRGRRR
mmetsp:Transcript_26681/g.41545  ORF Transcript_26681/g.41545 Transcript_26681/m.41545 type:complete len:340 (-) Transcript_26681:90-1109(-)